MDEHARNIMTMELLQCDHLERKLELAFAHTVSKLESPVSSKVLVVLPYFYTQKIILDACGNTSEICTYYWHDTKTTTQYRKKIYSRNCNALYINSNDATFIPFGWMN